MKRYQLYLNPTSVNVIDEFEQLVDISRSKIIRKIVEIASEQLLTLIRRKEPQEKYLMDTLAGFIDLKTNKKLDLASTVDEVYLKQITQ